jgi:hypothetical protein
MRPVRASVEVPYPREEVYDFLDVMANHEPFTNHMMRDWEYSGPDRGVGSRARVRADLGGGRTDIVEIEVISASDRTQSPSRTRAPVDGGWRTAPTFSSNSPAAIRALRSSTHGSGRPSANDSPHPSYEASCAAAHSRR